MDKIRPIIILMFYDVPQVFIGNSIVDQNYCCMMVSEDDNGPQYLCTPISKQRKLQLSAGKVDLREVFENPESKTFFRTSYESGDDHSIYLHKEDFSSCPEKLLPKPGLFFDGYDQVMSKALELNTTVTYASLSVPESKEQTRINSNTLAQFLTHYQSVIKHLSKRVAKRQRKRLDNDSEVHNLDVFGFAYGSFTVQMRSSNDEGDLLGENSILTSVLEELGIFLGNIEDTELSIRYLRSLKGRTAATLIKLLYFLDERNCPLKHQWATPSFAESHISITTTSGVKKLIEQCKRYTDLIVEDVTLVGVVQSANITGNTWRILNEEDSVHYSGDVAEDANISMSGIVIQNKRYKFKCKERIDVNVGTGKEKSHFSVFEIEEL